MIFYPSAKDRAQISISRFSPSFLINKPIIFFPFIFLTINLLFLLGLKGIEVHL